MNIYRHKALIDRISPDRTVDDHSVNVAHETTFEFASRCFAATGYGLPHIQMEVPIRDLPHPAHRVTLPISLDDSRNHIQRYIQENSSQAYFTDASQICGGPVGYACVVWLNNHWQVCISGCLPKHYSVFSGEFAAIHNALRFLQRSSVVGKVGIFTDSKSSLESLHSDNCDKSVQDVITTWTTLKENGCHVNFYWVPSHVGIPGNEAADAAAKEATLTPAGFDTPDKVVTIHMLKQKLRSYSLSQWQQNWTTSSSGRFTYTIFPRVSSKLAFQNTPLSHRNWKLLLKASTGHFPVNSYLFRFRLHFDDRCPFCSQCETLEHTLTVCPRFDLQRFTFLLDKGLQSNRVPVERYFQDVRLLPLTAKILHTRYSYHLPNRA
jgi:ribonuclease HI